MIYDSFVAAKLCKEIKSFQATQNVHIFFSYINTLSAAPWPLLAARPTLNSHHQNFFVMNILLQSCVLLTSCQRNFWKKSKHFGLIFSTNIQQILAWDVWSTHQMKAKNKNIQLADEVIFGIWFWKIGQIKFPKNHSRLFWRNFPRFFFRKSKSVFFHAKNIISVQDKRSCWS